MSKPLSKTPPPETPSPLKRRLMRTSCLYAVSPAFANVPLRILDDILGEVEVW